MAKRSLLSEAQLKAYLKGKVSGKCFHYQIYRTLKERGPSTVNDIIRDWKARLPRMGRYGRLNHVHQPAIGSCVVD